MVIVDSFHITLYKIINNFFKKLNVNTNINDGDKKSTIFVSLYLKAVQIDFAFTK